MANQWPTPTTKTFANGVGAVGTVPASGIGEAGDLLFACFCTRGPTSVEAWPEGWTVYQIDDAAPGHSFAFKWATSTLAEPEHFLNLDVSDEWASYVVRVSDVASERGDPQLWWNIGLRENTDNPDAPDAFLGPRGAPPDQSNTVPITGMVFANQGGSQSRPAAYPSLMSVWSGAHGTGGATTDVLLGMCSSRENDNAANLDHAAAGTFNPSEWGDWGGNLWTRCSVVVMGGYAAISDPSFTWEQQAGTASVRFTDTTPHQPTEWHWDFGDGGAEDTVQDPVRSFTPGTYTVTLTATNPANEEPYPSVQVEITVTSPAPIASWQYVNLAGSLDVQFFDQSIYTSSWLWEIWHGTDTGVPPDATYTEHSPRHTFPAEGGYAVRLTATSDGGSDVFARLVTVFQGDPHPVRPDGLDVRFDIQIDGEWVDLYCPLIGASWGWGASKDDGVFTQAISTTLTCSFWDVERDLDPGNPGSKYASRSDPGGLIRVAISGLIVFVGRIESLTHDMSVAAMEVVDLISRFSAIDADTGGPLGLPQQTASTRIESLLDSILWPSSARQIAPDATVMAAVDVSDATYWDTMVETALQALGRVQASQDGRFIYTDRSLTWAYEDPRVLLGCSVDATAGVSTINTLTSLDKVRNEVSAALRPVEGEDPVPIVKDDLDSQDAYGRRSLVHHELDLVGTAERDSWASFVIAHHGAASYGIGTTDFILSPDAALLVCSSAVGEVWRIVDDHHGQPVDIIGRLIGLRYTLSPDAVRVVASFMTDETLDGAPATRDVDLSLPYSQQNTKANGAAYSLDKAGAA